MLNYEYEVPLPGVYIEEELVARGWSQRDLAFILGIQEPDLNKIIKGKTGVSFEMSKALAKAFDVDPDFFSNLQKAYDFSHAKEPDPAIERRAFLQRDYPVREMIKRSWLKNAEVGALEDELKKFFKAENDNVAMPIRHAAKKTNIGEDPTYPQLAWLHRVVQLAEAMDCKPYSERALSAAKLKLKTLMNNPENIKYVPEILAGCGLRFVIVEGLPGGKIDGVCIWLNPDTPIIAMSCRLDRIDNFWFVLWHELTHVLNRDGKSECAWIVDVSLEKDRASDSETNSQQERKANAGAAENCIPQGELASFMVGRSRYVAEDAVLRFARKMKVHPGIVVGQIQNRTGRYELLRKYQVKVREFIMPTATVDGWGQVASIST
jgi:HTH-type transcriptional regulator/antitoxin HigA